MNSKSDLNELVDRICNRYEITDDNLVSALKEIVSEISRNENFARNLQNADANSLESKYL